MQDKRLKNADVNSFEVLNYCFAKDRHFVWCLGGEFRPYDIETFEVCDDGFNKNLMHQTFIFQMEAQLMVRHKFPQVMQRINIRSIVMTIQVK